MADRDPAFQWETEALRAAAGRRAVSRRQAAPEPIEPGWVTIRQAEGATGIPVGTLRRWTRQGSLPSRSQDTGAGTRRLVWLDAVLERAAALGRTEQPHDVIETPPVRERPGPPPPPPRPQPQPPVDIPGQQVLVEVEPVAQVAAETGETPQPEVVERPQPQPQVEPQPTPEPGEPTTGPPEPPPGTMLVPVDAWNKMLMQLGNLHEAGRELAEARERAAKAETEATFLRERLKESRDRSREESASGVDETKRRRWFGGR